MAEPTLDTKKLKAILEDYARLKKQHSDGLMQKGFAEQLLDTVSKDLGKILLPVLEEMAENAESSNKELVSGIAETLKKNVNLDSDTLVRGISEALRGHGTEASIEIIKALKQGFDAMELKPEIKVNIPDIVIPEPKPVELVLPSQIQAVLDYNYENPLPVLLMGLDGKPFQFSSLGGGAGGGRGDFYTIVDIRGSTSSIIDQTEGALRVYTVNAGSSSGGSTTVALVNADNLYYNSDNPFFVYVSNIFGSTASSMINPDGRLKVDLPTGSSGLTDTELRAASLLVQQVSGAVDSVVVNGSFGTTFTTSDMVNSDNRLRVSLETGGSGLTDAELRAASLVVQQLSGSSFSSNVLGTVFVRLENADGGYTGTNPLPVTLAGASATSIAVGDVVSDAADSGSAPQKTGGIARTANPTAVANGDRVSTSYDDLGRQVMVLHNVRDLRLTAYVSVTNGTETTLRAAVAGAFLDLIYIVGSNNSDAAVSVDIRAVTAGNIINTLRIPANGSAGWAPSVPWPQDETGNNWTVDGPDETGRTLTFSALFSREI